MHHKPVIAANWKLNHGPTDAKAFLQRFLAQAPKMHDRTLVFFPSAITVSTVVEGLRERPDIWVGVQNVHAEAQGAFTGENSVLMARDVGARVVLVGHSERRHVFGETDAMTTQKMALICQARLVPMLCVGETLDEREAGATAAVVERQLSAGLAFFTIAGGWCFFSPVVVHAAPEGTRGTFRITLAVSDIAVPAKKAEIIAGALKEVEVVQRDFRRGLLTEQEKNEREIEISLDDRIHEIW